MQNSVVTLNLFDYIYGCIDQNAINFDENATSQLFYQNYNSTNNYSSCIYNSCQNVQENGIYSGALKILMTIISIVQIFLNGVENYAH